ncbi:MAG: hypothetical protein HUU57_10715 [Bdellovibrio sp.]|nr:hypothetical protein [Bdellovibrio sp.]
MKVFAKCALMIFLLQGSLALAAANSEALKKVVEGLHTCGNFIRFDEKNVFTGFGPYWTSHAEPREALPGKIWAAAIDGSKMLELKTLDSAVDLMTFGKMAYVLTYSGIEVWDLNSRERMKIYPTYNTSAPFMDRQHPQAFALYGKKIIIAHGRFGVSFFDINAGRITNQYMLATKQEALESMATGVAVSGKYAYVVMDSYTLVEKNEKPPFRGLIVIDMETEQIVSELDGMDPGADSVTADQSNIVVSFMGQPLWKYATSSLHDKTLPSPLKRVWKFPYEGRAVGAASMDDQYYYTCFSKVPGPGEGSYMKKIPLALDRKAMKLD